MMDMAAKALPHPLFPASPGAQPSPEPSPSPSPPKSSPFPNIKNTLPAPTLNLDPAYGHVATYIDAATGHAFDFAAEGFTGEPSIAKFDSTDYTPPPDLHRHQRQRPHHHRQQRHHPPSPRLLRRRSPLPPRRGLDRDRRLPLSGQRLHRHVHVPRRRCARLLPHLWCWVSR